MAKELNSRGPNTRRQTRSFHPAVAETLEARRLFSVNVVVHHGDATNDGANLNETVLTPANVNASDFGKLFTTTLDSQIYAQPLYVQNVNITTGSSQGIHSMVFQATMHDSLYAIDANTGAILWQDSFLNINDPTNLTATTGVTTMPTVNLNSSLGPELGILSTPTIDLATGRLYLNAATREVRGTDVHWVQRLWAVNISDGSIAGSTVIGDTIFNGANNQTSYSNYQYVAGPIVNGSGNNNPTTPTPTYPDTDGWTSAPGGASGYVIAFNALQQMERTAVTLINGTVYLGFASHADNGPYYGWVLGYSASTLALTAAFNTTPTYEGIVGDREAYTAQGGIWGSGTAIATDGTYLYLLTGNGAFNTAASNFDAQGFPIDHDYADALLKLAVDPNSSPTSQNGNGWGLKVADYFTPSNATELNIIDDDLGSGGVTLLPASITDAAGNPMLVMGGKESRVYLVDIDNMGKFNFNYPATGNPDPRLYDRVLGEYPNDGINGVTADFYANASYYNGQFYFDPTRGAALAFTLATFASGQSPVGTTTPPVAHRTTNAFGERGSTFTISANGNTDGIAWAIEFNANSTDDLLAYDASTLGASIYDSNTDSSRDALAGGVTGATGSRFSVPTEANGMVYLTTAGTPTTSLGTVLGYGLLPSFLSSNGANFSAPTGLTAAINSASDTHLAWTSHSTLATEYRIDRSTDGTNWTTLAYVQNGLSAYEDSTANGAAFHYRVVAVSGANQTAASVFSPGGTTSPTSVSDVVVLTADGSALAAGSSLDFGTVQDSQDQQPVSKTITILNNGATDLSLSTAIPTENDSSEPFTATVPSVATLTPGQSATFTVTLDVAHAGASGVSLGALSDELDISDVSGVLSPESLTLSATVTAPSTVGTTIDFSAHKPAVFTDAAGSEVTVRLTGPGTGTLGFATTGNADISDLTLTNTTAASSLNITPAHGASTNISGNVLITDTTGSAANIAYGSLGRFIAPRVNLAATAAGIFSVRGGIKTLSLGSVAGLEKITISGDSDTPAGDVVASKVLPLHLTAAAVSDTTFSDDQPITSIHVDNWTDTHAFDSTLAPQTEQIVAPSIGQIRSDGDFSVGLSLAGGLKSATIEGSLGVPWIIGAGAGTIRAGSIPTDFSGSVAGKLARLTVAHDDAGTLAAASFGNIVVDGNMTGAKLLAGVNLGTDGQIGGTGTDQDTYAAGSIASLRIDGSATNVLAGAGFQPTDGLFDNTTGQVIGGSASVIHKVVVKDIDEASRFVAGVFGTARIPQRVKPVTDSHFVVL